MKSKKILYMGTSDFAAYILDKLIQANFNTIGLVSQPDRAQNRKKEFLPTPTKQVALDNNLTIFQFDNLNNHYQEIVQFNPDLIITCAFGQKVGKEILDLPVYGCINIHASLLPKYRGAAPIHYAIINGDKITGNTIMYMEETLDTGAMINQSQVEIDIDDTYDTLAKKLMKDGADLIIKTIPDIFNDKLNAIKQDNDKATLAPMFKREDELINFDEDVIKVYNKMRGLISKPGCYAYLNDKKIKFYQISYEKTSSKVNEINTAKDYFSIGCQNGVIKVYEFQLEGKKRVKYLDYKNGHNLEIKNNELMNVGE